MQYSLLFKPSFRQVGIPRNDIIEVISTNNGLTDIHSAWEIVFDNNFRMFQIIKYIVLQLERQITAHIPILSSA